MTNDSKDGKSNARHWQKAAAGGVVVAVLLMVFNGTGLVTALISGGVVAAVAGYILTRMVGDRDVAEMARAAQDAAEQMRDSATTTARATETEPSAPAEPQAATAAREATQAPQAPARISASPLVKPSKPLPGQQELAARKGTWRYQGAAT
ncbi:hypothetical protein [Jhaorihella thermophila]|uniref:Uncharacterized protein n=1 Tax=Jhaorihella thermophila TaxID=488547 RepID=A0A1H5S3V8_9RHOB|nr:hypothetical protein [Jhaorihella thermophila]SEF45333.1 hypothetical protein SAMN05421751_101330 [Jhaorihella thermophila]